MSLDKTEVLSVGMQRQELGITLADSGIKQRDSFAYLGGMISAGGLMGRCVIGSSQGIWPCRNVGVVMSDRYISKKLKGMYWVDVIPACIYGLQQQRLQLCENN